MSARASKLQELPEQLLSVSRVQMLTDLDARTVRSLFLNDPVLRDAVVMIVGKMFITVSAWNDYVKRSRVAT